MEYVLCCENRGQKIGVTLHHPHGQVYAYPFVPSRVTGTLASARRHREMKGRCLVCDLVASELADEERGVVRSDNFVALVPFAPRWPIEVHTYLLHHVSNLVELDHLQLSEMMVVQSELVDALDRLFSRPMPYTAGWLQSPVHGNPGLNHLRTTTVSVRRTADKIKYFAGSETLVGGFTNDVAPEMAAQQLRAVWKSRSGHG